MRKGLRILLPVLVIGLIAGGLIRGFFSGRADIAAEEQGDAPIEGPSRVATQGGSTILSFPLEAQRANRIAVTRLSLERRTIEAQANGVVIDLQPILSVESNYNTAIMELAKARAGARASSAEFERLQQLNRNGQNASEKAVEAARATSESDAATERNAAQALALLRSSIALRWGTTLSQWVENGSRHLGELLAQRQLLLQVTAAQATSRSAQHATVDLPDGHHASAELLSALPQVDPRLQMPSYLYLVGAHAGLVPGMNLPVFLPTGPALSGLVIPRDAVVWWQGKAWCYVEETPGKFTRKEVPTSSPVSNGWFAAEGFAAGTKVVTSGAQTLLSEEFRSQIQTDED
jgi:hypothetical protein